jgi:PAS domain-containing protein
MLDTLMLTAVQHAGAERGLLILAQTGEQRIAAEATTAGDKVVVKVRDQPVAENVLPQSVFHYVLRTRESVILDDAAAQSPFATDPYVHERRARSVLCLPLLNRAKLIGVLYLENNLAPRVFVPARIAVLKLIASEAAISLENTLLYRDLAEREARIRRLVDANIIGIFIWDLQGRILDANDAFLLMVGYDRQDLVCRPHPLDGLDAAGVAGPRPATAGPRAEDHGQPAAVREGILPQGRQPRAGADRRGVLRASRQPGRRFRPGLDGTQALGGGSPRQRAAGATRCRCGWRRRIVSRASGSCPRRLPMR